MDELPSPEFSVPREDTGADTGGRYLYQDTWAAILACSLLDDPSVFTDIWCEHHEDILLKQSDGKFQGHQIKTRDVGEPWRAGDEVIIGALSRFVVLDVDYAGSFTKFVIATNYTFFDTAEHGSNLSYLIQEATGCQKDGTTPTRKLSKIIKKIAAKSGRSESEVLSTLSKTICDQTLPKRPHCQSGLCDALASAHPRGAAATRRELINAATALTDEIRRASNHSHTAALPAWFRALPNSDDLAAEECRKAKQFNRERVITLIGRALAPNDLLHPNTKAADYVPDEGQSILSQKLEAGGLSETTIHLASDLASSALSQLLMWQSVFGPERALERYRHLKALVLKDCAEAHEISKSENHCFGLSMQAQLRNRLEDLVAENPQGAFDCRPEHLEGIAYELTKECKVWWSKTFPLRT